MDAGKRCISVLLARTPLGDGNEYVRSLESPKAEIMTAERAMLLSRFASFQDVDALGAVFKEPDQVKAWRAEVARLVAQGWLASAAGVAERLGSTPTRTQLGARISQIGFVTRDRVATLAGAVESYAGNVRRHGRACEIVVADDSPSATVRESYRDELARLGARLGVHVSYAGLEEKRAFLAALAKSGAAPPELLEFALFDPTGHGVTIGANRNALLLHSVGEVMLCGDDDTLGRVASAPGRREGLGLRSDDPTELWFFRDQEELERSVAVEDFSILDLHEKLLGRDVPACIAEVGPLADDDLQRASSLLIARALYANTRVRVTSTGIVGDAGMDSPYYVLTREGGTRERLLRSTESFRSALRSREMLRAPVRASVGDWPTFMAGAFALDHRALTPPFLPVGRNEDGVFLTTVFRHANDWIFGFLPYAIAHRPVGARIFAPGAAASDAPTLSGVMISLLLRPCLADAPPIHRRKDWLPLLGRRLADLAALPERDFAELVRETCASGVAGRSLAAMQLSKRHGDAPDYWARELKDVAERARANLDRGHGVPGELLGGRRTEDEAVRRLQEIVRAFGRLMVAWPDICEAARDLRARGVTIARPLPAVVGPEQRA